MLTKNQFKIVNFLATHENATQREIAHAVGLGLATVNTTVKQCISSGLLEGGQLSQKGKSSLKPYRVDNAVILAAGLSSRFAPISYERPKGLLKVRGEILIERQIKQLKDAGITDITVVVGYKKEAFYYLEDKFGVKLVINNHYAERNNNSSMMLVRHLLKNTYICSSDNYFTENPFESHVWKSYYSAQFSSGPTNEWCLTTQAHDRITQVKIGGADSWFMIGHAYFDNDFSHRFSHILEEEYNLPQTKDKLWESIYIEHIKELDMSARKYDPPIIYEFDSLDELKEFDPLFLENLNSRIFDNITRVLDCEKSEIRDIYPLKQGLTNLSCHFKTNTGHWVYRHPGVGSELLVDRHAERVALETAKTLGLDSTFVYADPDHGWKISRFVPNVQNLDPHNMNHLQQAMEMARKLHESGAKVERYFSFYTEAKLYEERILERTTITVEDWPEMKQEAEQLSRFLELESSTPVLCHNDFFSLNFLLHTDGAIDLIDWEYAGMGDYANDFGTFSVCEQLNEEEMRQGLAFYFGRTPTCEEWRHNLAHVAMAGWCWYAWALLKETEGDNVGEWSHIYYSYAKKYLRVALELYSK